MILITGPGGWPRTVVCGPRPLKSKSTRGEMNAGLFITRVASERRDAQNERDGAGLRSSVAAATLSQLRRSRTTTQHSTGRLPLATISKEEPPSTAHRRGTLPSLADAAASELMLLRRS